MNGLQAYVLSRKHVDEVALGIASMSVSGTTVNFVTTSGVHASVTLPTPADGVSITDVDVDTNKHLICMMSNGNTIDAGLVPTVKGDDGLGIKNIVKTLTTDNVDTYTITMTDNKTTFTFEVTNAKQLSNTELEKIIKEYLVNHPISTNIDSISVNGVNIAPDINKNVDITVPTEPTNKLVLDKFTEDATGNVLYDGKKIESDMTGYAKQSDVDTALGLKADKTDIPDVSSFVSETDIDNKITTATTDMETKTDVDTKLTDYVKTVDLPKEKTKLSEFTNDADFVTTSSINAKLTADYLTKTETNTAIADEIAKVVANAPEDFDTLKEVADFIAADKEKSAQLITDVAALKTDKADKTEIPDVSEFVTETDIDNKIATATDDIATLTAVDEKIEKVNEVLNTKEEKLKVYSGALLHSEETLEGYAQITEFTKNLCINDYVGITTGEGATWTVNDDGSVSVSGTFTERNEYILFRRAHASETTGSRLVLPAGTYTLSGCPARGTGNRYVINIGCDNPDDPGKYFAVASDTGNGVTFTLEKETTLQIVLSVYAADSPLDNLTFKPMLVKGTEVKPFVPYNGYNIKSVGKNLFPPFFGAGTSRVDNGITFTKNDDNSITVDGTKTSANQAIFNLTFRTGTNFILPPGNYFASGCPTGGSAKGYYIQLGKTLNGAWDLVARDLGEGVAFTLTEPTQLTVGIGVSGPTTSVSNLVFRPMIQVGEQGSEYEPYKESLLSITSESNAPQYIPSYAGETNVYVNDYNVDLTGIFPTTISGKSMLDSAYLAQSKIGNLAEVATTGSYNDLKDKPDITNIKKEYLSEGYDLNNFISTDTLRIARGSFWNNFTINGPDDGYTGAYTLIAYPYADNYCVQELRAVQQNNKAKYPVYQRTLENNVWSKWICISDPSVENYSSQIVNNTDLTITGSFMLIKCGRLVQFQFSDVTVANLKHGVTICTLPEECRPLINTRIIVGMPPSSAAATAGLTVTTDWTVITGAITTGGNVVLYSTSNGADIRLSTGKMSVTFISAN